MDKLTAIKIKYQDDSYSDEIPIGVLSENVEWDITHNLVDILGHVSIDTKGNIQAQIDSKLDGNQLSQYVDEQLASVATDWLDDHLTPVGEKTTILVDDSLSVSGAGADAKIVGDQIADLKNDNNILASGVMNINNIVSTGYRIGTISSTDGTDEVSTSQIRTAEYMPSYCGYILTAKADIKVRMTTYTTAKVYSATGAWHDVNTGATYTLYSGSSSVGYLRFVFAYQNDASLSGNADEIADSLFTLTRISTSYAMTKAVDDIGAVSYDIYNRIYGHATNSNTWNNINASYQHIVIPINPGDVIKISLDGETVVGFLKSYTPARDGAAISYSSVTGYTTKITVAVTPRYFVAPSDAKYMFIQSVMSDVAKNANILEINGYDYAKNLVDNIRELIPTKPYAVEWESGAINGTTGVNQSASNRIRCVGYLDLQTGVKVKFTVNDMKLWLIAYDDSNNVTTSTGWQTADFIYYPHSLTETKFRFFVGYTNDSNIPNAFIGNKIIFEPVVVNADAPMWYALGDSITQGYYSEVGTSGIAGLTPMGYPSYAAYENGWKMVNLGVGGSGYLKASDSLSKPNAKGQVDAIDFSKCDICTLAFGVNDWHYNQNIGTVDDAKSLGTTMASNMKYVIEKILDDNPLCRLNIMLPLNCSTYGGDFASDWGLGTTLPTSGTLQHVIDVIKSVAEMYHLPIIDQSNTGIVNRYNINDALPDGIHPALNTYKAYGLRLARQII